MAEFREFTKDAHDSVELCVSINPNTISAVKAVEITMLVNPDGRRTPVFVLIGTPL